MLGQILGAIIGYGVAQGGWRSGAMLPPPTRVMRQLPPPMRERIFPTGDIPFGTPFFGLSNIPMGGGGASISAPIAPSMAAPPMMFAPGPAPISPGIVLPPFVPSVSTTVQPTASTMFATYPTVVPTPLLPTVEPLPLPYFIPSAPEVILQPGAIATVPLTLESLFTPVLPAPLPPPQTQPPRLGTTSVYSFPTG